MTEFNREVPRWLELFSHPINPLGNYQEPLPFPQKRAEQYKETVPRYIPEWVWWNLYRNPFHNLTHFWLGITPLGERYEWILPEENGWERITGEKKSTGKDGYINVDWWKKKNRLSLPIIKFQIFGFEGYAGWMSRGNLGLAFRKAH